MGRRKKNPLFTYLMVIVMAVSVLGAMQVEVRADADLDITGSFTCPIFLARIRALPSVPNTGAIHRSHVENISGTLNFAGGPQWIDMATGWVEFDPITSLDGIEFFTSVQVLDVSHNLLEELDLSQNTSLAALTATNNQLDTVSLPQEGRMHWIQLANNDLTSLDIRDVINENSPSKFVDVRNNNMTGLNDVIGWGNYFDAEGSNQNPDGSWYAIIFWPQRAAAGGNGDHTVTFGSGIWARQADSGAVVTSGSVVPNGTWVVFNSVPSGAQTENLWNVNGISRNAGSSQISVNINQNTAVSLSWSSQGATLTPRASVSVMQSSAGVYAHTTPANSAGNHRQGAMVTVHAGERDGHYFGGWAVLFPPGVTVPNNPSASFIMPAPPGPRGVEVMAVWSTSPPPVRHRVNFFQSPEIGGTVTASVGGNSIGSGHYVDGGATVRFEAVPNSGFVFTGYQVNNVSHAAPAGNSFDVVIDENTTVIVSFAVDGVGHAVTFSANTQAFVPGMGQLTSGDQVPSGTWVVFNASVSIPQGHWPHGWTFTGSQPVHLPGFSEVASVLVTQATRADLLTSTVVSPVSFSLVAVGNHRAGDQWASGAGAYEAGRTATVHAGPPDPGMRFNGWTSLPPGIITAGINNPVASFVVPLNPPVIEVRANWIADGGGVGVPNRTVSITNAPLGATPTGQTAGGPHPQGSTVSLTAGDRPGYIFVNWTASPALAITNANQPNASFTVPANDVTITANWVVDESIERFAVTITNNPPGVAVGQSGAGEYVQGATVPLVAGDRVGYDFVNWTATPAVAITNANEPNASFTMPGNAVAVTANWEEEEEEPEEPTPPVITTTSLPNGAVGQLYTATLAATGSTPIAWSIETGDLPSGLSLNGTTGVISGTPTNTGTSTFTVRAENEYDYDTRQFSIVITQQLQDIYTLTVRAERGGRISLDEGPLRARDSLTFRAGDRVPIYARPDRGYEFDGWTYSFGDVQHPFREHTNFTMPNRSVTVWAEFIYTGDYRGWDEWDLSDWRPDYRPIPTTAPFTPQPAGQPSAPRPSAQHAPAGRPVLPAPLPDPTPTVSEPATVPLSVSINGRPFNFGGQPAVLASGIPLVPIGELFRELGFTVTWDAVTQTATMVRGSVTIIVTEGSRNFTINGINRNLRAPATVINGHMMVSFVEIIDSIGGRAYLDDNGVVNIFLTR